MRNIVIFQKVRSQAALPVVLALLLSPLPHFTVASCSLGLGMDSNLNLGFAAKLATMKRLQVHNVFSSLIATFDPLFLLIIL